MSKLLIVDDESAIRTLIVKYATYEGYEVEKAFDGPSGLEKLHPNLPIILLSARGEEYDRINGFEIGADDYVVKPFSPKELMLRVSAILKRVKKSPETTTNFFRLGGLSVDFTARIVKIDGKRIELSPKEYELLFYMIRNANIALTREKLICEVWGYDFYGDDRTLDTHIKLLRRSLGEYSRYIVTLRGVGYRFDTNQ